MKRVKHIFHWLNSLYELKIQTEKTSICFRQFVATANLQQVCLPFFLFIATDRPASTASLRHQRRFFQPCVSSCFACYSMWISPLWYQKTPFSNTDSQKNQDFSKQGKKTKKKGLSIILFHVCLRRSNGTATASAVIFHVAILDPNSVIEIW